MAFYIALSSYGFILGNILKNKWGYYKIDPKSISFSLYDK